MIEEVVTIILYQCFKLKSNIAGHTKTSGLISHEDECTAVQHCNAISECTAFNVSFNKFTNKKKFQ